MSGLEVDMAALDGQPAVSRTGIATPGIAAPE